MPRVTHVQKARKDNPKFGIKKGDEYWHWSFMSGGRGGPKICSKKPPQRCQLTQSSFLSQLWAMQDNFGTAPEDCDSLKNNIEEVKGELENMRDECQGSLDNMPEGLQQGDSGQTLQARIDSIEEVIGELDGIDTDFDTEGGEDQTEWLSARWQEVQDAVGNVGEG